MPCFDLTARVPHAGPVRIGRTGETTSRVDVVANTGPLVLETAIGAFTARTMLTLGLCSGMNNESPGRRITLSCAVAFLQRRGEINVDPAE